MQPKEFYTEQVTKLTAEITQFKSKLNAMVFIRLVTFLIIPLVLYFGRDYFNISVPISIGFFFVFLFLVRRNVNLKNQLHYLEELLAINENELKTLTGNYSMNDAGLEFKNLGHAFTYDFDVFANKGIFQFLNRTTSQKGKERLASHLSNGVEDYKDYHETSEYLQNYIEWTQKYRARGKVNEEEKKPLGVEEWLQDDIKAPSWMNIARFVLPIVAFTGLGLYVFNVLTDMHLIVVLTGCLIPIGRYYKRTNFMAFRLGLLKDRLQAINAQTELIKSLVAESKQLKIIHKDFFEGNQNAAGAFSELAAQIEKFDLRMNVLVSVVLNIFLAYDFQLLLGLNKWKKTYETAILDWEAHLVEVEAIISMATFKYNTQEKTCYPELLPKDNPISIENLGHPLLVFKEMVLNNYNLPNGKAFSIITGPNMAGKSTFLRAVGVNLMLAKAGFSVVASSFQFPKLNLYSSMRTADDLTEESSYFHAELIRLRFIVDAIDRGEPVFIILDEILKGTNSKDKEEGSARFLTKLISLKAKGIIATHDLSLTKLEETDSAIQNKFFDSTISGDEISFSYKISDGVVQNMNASFLLNQMGLV